MAKEQNGPKLKVKKNDTQQIHTKEYRALVKGTSMECWLFDDLISP